MVFFQYQRATFTQILNLVLDHVTEDADQGADDEHPAKGREDQHDQAESPPLVCSHGARVKGSHQAQPEGFNER